MKKWIASAVSLGLVFTMMTVKPMELHAAQSVDQITLKQSAYEIGDGWTVNANFSNNEPTTIIKGNNEYMTIGYYGTVMKSKDGKQWTTLSRFANYQLTALAWNGTHYVLAGSNTEYSMNAIIKSSELFISKDGLSWEKIDVSFNDTISYIEYGHEAFIASGKKGVYRSKDGKTWTETLKHKDDYYYHPLFYVNNTFFLYVYEQNIMYTSKDGQTWTKHTYDTNATIQSFIWYNGQYVGVSNEGIFKSSDGIKWTLLSNSPKHTDFRAITTNDQLIVVMGLEDAENQVVYTSKDLKSWSKKALTHMNHKAFGIYPVADGFAGLSFNDNTPIYSMYSKDGLTWTYSLLGVATTGEFSAIAYNGKRAVAVGSLGSIIYSDNGTSWKGAQPLANNSSYGRPYFFDIEYGANKFVAVGNNGIYTSTDGVSWTKNNSIKQQLHLSELHWTGKYYIASGQFQGVYYSKDGVSWTKVNSVSKDSSWLMSMADDGKKLIGAFYHHNNGNSYVQLMQTTDGINWSNITKLNNGAEVALAYNGEVFVAAPAYIGDTLWVSKDGISWSKVNPKLAAGDSITYITAYDGYFVGFNNASRFIDGEYVKQTAYYTSKDGHDWKKHDVPARQAVETFGDERIFDSVKAFGKYIFVGAQGYIMYTNDLNFESPIYISVLGKPLAQTVEQGKAFIENGTTYLPLRVIGEALGYEIVWNAQQKTVTFNGEGKSETFSQVKLKNSLSYVPLRQVSETLGYVVNYNKVNDEVTVSIENKK